TDEDEVLDIPEPIVATASTNPPAAAIPTQAPNGSGPQVIPTVAVQDAQPLPTPPVIKNDRTDTILPKNTGGLDLPPPPDKQETPTTAPQPVVAAISDVPPSQEEKRDDAIYVPFLGYIPKSALVAAPDQTEEIVDVSELLGGHTNKPGTERTVVPKDEGP